MNKKLHNPPYQPFYVTYELPKDDMYFVYNDRVYQAKPTVHQFVPLKNTNKQNYLSVGDIHGFELI
jgi:hypothetical protein